MEGVSGDEKENTKIMEKYGLKYGKMPKNTVILEKYGKLRYNIPSIIVYTAEKCTCA
jgi:hypothetical protein